MRRVSVVWAFACDIDVVGLEAGDNGEVEGKVVEGYVEEETVHEGGSEDEDDSFGGSGNAAIKKKKKIRQLGN